jgi:hypothetical protein
MRKKRFFSLPCVVVVLTTATVFCHTPDVPASVLPTGGEYITSTTYMDSRYNTQNMSGSKIKLTVNGIGTGSNDGSLTRALFSLPTDLESIPAANVVSAKIYFYNYGVTLPNYGADSNPPAFTMPDVVLHPLTQGFSYTGATWNSPDKTVGTAWSVPWTTPSSPSGTGGPFEASVSVAAVDVNTGGKPTANNWSYFDVTSLWGDSDFLQNGVVMMFSNEVVPVGSSGAHVWITENWANQNWLAPPDGFPYIVVTTTPEPSTLALGLSGAAALGLALRRRWMRMM